MIEGFGSESGSATLTNGSRIRTWETQKHTDLTDPDPDPKHWFNDTHLHVVYFVVGFLWFISVMRITVRRTTQLIAQENINGRDQFRILVRAVGYTIHGLIPASCVFADRHGTYCLTYNNEANIQGGRKIVHVVFIYLSRRLL
jgi:hypothetical protein